MGRCGEVWLEDTHPAALPPTQQALKMDGPSLAGHAREETEPSLTSLVPAQTGLELVVRRGRKDVYLIAQVHLL